MPNIKYLIRRVTRMDYKAMNAKIKDIHEKSGKSRVWIFFDMIHCGRKFGAGYMDYWLYEMYNLNDKERDTYITRGRNYDLVKRYNDPAYTDLIDNKIEFNKRFGEFLGRKWLEIRKDNKQEVLDFINSHDFLIAKADLGSCGKTVEKIDCKKEKAEDIYERLVNQERPHFFEEVIVQLEMENGLFLFQVLQVYIKGGQTSHIGVQSYKLFSKYVIFTSFFSSCAGFYGVFGPFCPLAAVSLWGECAGGRYSSSHRSSMRKVVPLPSSEFFT